MAVAVSSASTPVSMWQAPLGLLQRVCQKIYDLAMRVIKSLCGCFCTQPVSTSPTAAQPVTPVTSTTAAQPVTPVTEATRPALTSSEAPAAAAPNDRLLDFYRGVRPTDHGVTRDQILGWNDERLEADHSYIQWLFPLTTVSSFNPTAPTLSPLTIQTFTSDSALQNRVLQSFRRMLSFYGLQTDGNIPREIVRIPNAFNTRAAVWLTGNNHNFLRITRIITSMNILGLMSYSRAFFRIMQDIYQQEGRGIISAHTFSIWQNAASTT